MIALIAVLRIAPNISSLIDCSELWMISSVMGSACVVTVRSRSDGDVEIAVLVDCHAVSRVDDRRAALGLDDCGALEAHSRLEQVAVVDLGNVVALGCVVHFAPPLCGV